MKHIFNFFALTLAFIFSLFGLLFASNNLNSTVKLEPKVSGIRGVTSTTTRLLHVTDEITGAFVVIVSARFDNVTSGWYQRVFDFGNGAEQDNIALGQIASSNDMYLLIVIGDKKTRCIATNAIVQGEVATWKAGVNSDGLQWLEKNGNRVCTIQGQIPRNVVRTKKLIGQSNWAADTPLKGAVLGIDVTNAGEICDRLLLNKPDQIRGVFAITVQARFDAPQAGSWQRVFDFGNGGAKDNVALGQFSNTNDMTFEIWRDGARYRLIAPGAIITGELATWKVGVEANGLMLMEKSGTRIAKIQGILPAAVQRNSNLVGSSNWGLDTSLDGVVLGLTVSPSIVVPSLLVAD
jgi:hypothetical protein